MPISRKETGKKEDLEDSEAGEIGSRPVSPKAYNGGQAPGTLRHVIVRGMEFGFLNILKLEIF